MMTNLCPCHSGEEYEKCCKRFHKSLAKPSPVELMRSRYSAYALSLTSYIMKTTHPKGAHFEKNSNKWNTSLLDFCKSTEFIGLEILSSSIENEKAFVTFFARLKQNGSDCSYTEKSTFKREDGVWLYYNGVNESGLAPHLI